MNTARVNAYAKLNLTLDITGTRDGYHMLDSLVVTVDLFDKIVAKKRKDALCSVTMHGMGSEAIPPEHNNALKAAEAFVSRFRTTGANITVYKNIPMGAGLGGSSADISGVLLAMAKLYDISDMGALKSLADELGSDTGYLLTGGLARMQGRGEAVEPLPMTDAMHFLLIVPREGTSTAECYQEYDGLDEEQRPRTVRALDEWERGLEWAAPLFGNHLFPAAKRLTPAVGEAYLEARSFSPMGAGMTGSGSACWALFPTRELAEWAKSRYRGKHRALVVKSYYPKAEKKWRNPFVLGEDEGKGE